MRGLGEPPITCIQACSGHLVFVLTAYFLQILQGSNNFSWEKDRSSEMAWEKVTKSITKAHEMLKKDVVFSIDVS